RDLDLLDEARPRLHPLTSGCLAAARGAKVPIVMEPNRNRGHRKSGEPRGVLARAAVARPRMALRCSCAAGLSGPVDHLGRSAIVVARLRDGDGLWPQRPRLLRGRAISPAACTFPD